MEGQDPSLEQRRQNAIEAVEKLLRVTADHEDEDWRESYEPILESLKAGSDEEAIALEKTIASRIPQDPSGRFSLQPRWVVSENLAQDVAATLNRLRIHVRYGDRRPLIDLGEPHPDIRSEGTRQEVREAARRRDPVEQKHDRLRERLGPWLEPHKRPAWLPVCEDRDGPLTASKFAGTPWLADGEPWPACGSCHRPLELFLQLNLSELPQEVSGRFGSGLLQLFYCRHTSSAGDCSGEGFEPFSDCQQVRVVQPTSSSGRPKVPAGVGAFSPRTIVAWDRIEDLPSWGDLEELGLHLHLDDYNRLVWIECPELELASEQFPLGTQFEYLDGCNGGDKLAGWPLRIQEDEFPMCRRCRRSMQYVFQYTGDELPFMLGDSGIGHITQCPDHPEVVAFGWTCH